jgi:hypothetical protein
VLAAEELPLPLATVRLEVAQSAQPLLAPSVVLIANLSLHRLERESGRPTSRSVVQPGDHVVGLDDMSSVVVVAESVLPVPV